MSDWRQHYPYSQKHLYLNWSVQLRVLCLGLLQDGDVGVEGLKQTAGKDTIVLADFTNKSGDTVFDDTLRQGLSVQLEQSPFLSLLSVGVGEGIMRDRAATMKRVTLELGGKSPTILLDDAALDQAISAALVLAFITSFGLAPTAGASFLLCSWAFSSWASVR